MHNIARQTRLVLSNIEYYAYHGVLSEERRNGSRYQVDCELEYDATTAVVSDDLSDALNYEEVLFRINEHMNGEPYELIETLCYDIATAILESFGQVRNVTVRVRKLHVPIQQVIDYVEAEITATR
ncbi:MAG: dihydroneopterin aldolase [Bradyrhizobiaceae bacterium]|nr:dihydroneopterin aldolase [Bradyrhizobiaceae bacterium]